MTSHGGSLYLYGTCGFIWQCQVQVELMRCIIVNLNNIRHYPDFKDAERCFLFARSLQEVDCYCLQSLLNYKNAIHNRL